MCKVDLIYIFEGINIIDVWITYITREIQKSKVRATVLLKYKRHIRRDIIVNGTLVYCAHVTIHCSLA